MVSAIDRGSVIGLAMFSSFSSFFFGVKRLGTCFAMKEFEMGMILPVVLERQRERVGAITFSLVLVHSLILSFSATNHSIIRSLVHCGSNLV